MEKMSYYSFVAAVIATGLAFLLYVGYALSGLRAARMQTAGNGWGLRTGTLGLVVEPRTATFGRYGSILGWLAFGFLSAWLVFRTIASGHGPFSNMYEFSVAFAWGILGAYYWFERSYHQRILGLLALPIALAMMIYAATIPSTIEPLVPALQNNLLLTVHVAVAIVAYGSFRLPLSPRSFLFSSARSNSQPSASSSRPEPGRRLDPVAAPHRRLAAVVTSDRRAIVAPSTVVSHRDDRYGRRQLGPPPAVLDDHKAVVAGFHSWRP
jgi:hypothetical protein